MRYEDNKGNTQDSLEEEDFAYWDLPGKNLRWGCL